MSEETLTVEVLLGIMERSAWVAWHEYRVTDSVSVFFGVEDKWVVLRGGTIPYDTLEQAIRAALAYAETLRK